jgi:hypothetical protein
MDIVQNAGMDGRHLDYLQTVVKAMTRTQAAADGEQTGREAVP